MKSDSWLKASVWLGFREANQLGISLLLELDGPSWEALEEVSSMDMLPCGSGKGCHLFGHGDHLGSGLGEAVVDGCSSAWGVLVNGAEWSDKINCPNNTWLEVDRFSLRVCRAWSRDGLTGGKKVVTTFTFLYYGLYLKLVHMFYMFPVKSCWLSRLHSNILTKGLQIGSFWLLELVAP